MRRAGEPRLRICSRTGRAACCCAARRQSRQPRGAPPVLRRWAAAPRLRRFLTRAWSGLPLGLRRRLVSTVTGGPPSVAILVETVSASGETGRARCGKAPLRRRWPQPAQRWSPAARLVCRCGWPIDGTCSCAPAAGASPGAAAAGFQERACRTSRRPAASALRLQCGDRLGLGWRLAGAASSAGAASAACCSCGRCGDRGVSSGAFSSAAGGSTRSIASTGLAGFGLLREYGFGGGAPGRVAGEFLVGGAQQRRRAEPEDQYRHRQHDRGEQKTEAGQHGKANSALAGESAKAFEHPGTR